MTTAPEQKKQLPKILDYFALPLFSILLSFFLAGLVIYLVGQDPWEAFGYMFVGVFGYSEGLGYTLYYATNFIFAGLAVSVAFNAMLFNIGGEGQAYMGGLGAGLVILALDGILPGVVVIILAIIASIVFGALWAFVPAYLRAKRGSHEVITTIMFYFMANAIMLYVIVEYLTRPGLANTESRTFAETTWLPYMHEITAWFGWQTAESPLNLSFIIAIVTAIGVWVYVYKTRWGYELRTLGRGDTVATYAGINPHRIIIIALCVSGGLSGMLAINEIIGVNHKLLTGFVAGAGFVGIAVSLIGRNHPLGVVLASLLFGFLYQGGAEMSFENPDISREMIVAIQGMIILFAGALPLMFKPIFVKLWHAHVNRQAKIETAKGAS